MSPSDTPPNDEAWVDPGAMDASIWYPRPPSRGRVWTTRLCVLMLTLLAPAAVWSNLWGLPDPGPLRPLSEWRGRDLPDELNAARYYRDVADRLGRRPSALVLPSAWVQVSTDDREALRDNAEWMTIWMAATRLADCRPNRERPEVAPLSEAEVSALARLAALEGLRLESLAQPEAALEWYLAMLRFSAHLRSRAGVYDWSRSVVVQQLASSRLRPWADHPNLAVDTLRRALAEVRAIRAGLVPITSAILNEADRVERLFGTEAGLRRLAASDAVSGRPAIVSQLSRFLQSEPERSRRVSRQVLANWFEAYADRTPPREGRALHFGSLALFPLRGAADSGRMRPASIAVRFETCRYAQEALPVLAGFIAFAESDERHQADLILALAEQLFRRTRGRAPVGPEELLGPDLPELP